MRSGDIERDRGVKVKSLILNSLTFNLIVCVENLPNCRLEYFVSKYFNKNIRISTYKIGKQDDNDNSQTFCSTFNIKSLYLLYWEWFEKCKCIILAYLQGALNTIKDLQFISIFWKIDKNGYKLNYLPAMRGRIWVCRRRRRSVARTAETCREAAWTRGTRAQEARVTSGTRAPHWPWHLSPQLNILQVKSIKNRRFEQRKTFKKFCRIFIKVSLAACDDDEHHAQLSRGPHGHHGHHCRVSCVTVCIVTKWIYI